MCYTVLSLQIIPQMGDCMIESGVMRLTGRAKYALFASFVCFCALVVALASFLNYKGMSESAALLSESVKAQVLSVASAAREIIDVDAFASYGTHASIDNAHYRDQLAQLRALAARTGTRYLYALKMIDGKSVFIFDSDETAENATLMVYELSNVHEEAFGGRDTAGISNMVDAYGSYSTGAVPLMMGDQVVGIVAADVEDLLVRKNEQSTRANFILLVASLSVILVTMSLVLLYLLDRLKSMQDDLSRMASYDKLTGLPNRLYLMGYLKKLTSNKNSDPFALFFVDLDNFKKVNDSAGHDAGDALLRNIANYLDSAQNASKAFRPTAGKLSVAARIGGDEFLLVVPGIGTANGAMAFADTLLAGFATKEIDRYIKKYQVGLSIGVALYPRNAADFNLLIKYADIAMYHAKRAGKNCSRLYDDEMQSKTGK